MKRVELNRRTHRVRFSRNAGKTAILTVNGNKHVVDWKLGMYVLDLHQLVHSLSTRLHKKELHSLERARNEFTDRPRLDEVVFKQGELE